MRGTDRQQPNMFSYLSPDQRVPEDHPLRPIRVMVDEALEALSPRFEKLYSNTGRPFRPSSYCELFFFKSFTPSAVSGFSWSSIRDRSSLPESYG